MAEQDGKMAKSQAISFCGPILSKFLVSGKQLGVMWWQEAQSARRWKSES